MRPSVSPRIVSGPGLDPAAGYVRRYWTAALGSTAVRDLLRLIQAAKRGESILRPVTLPRLAECGLVVQTDGDLFVRDRVPRLPAALVARLPVSLRRELESGKLVSSPETRSG